MSSSVLTLSYNLLFHKILRTRMHHITFNRSFKFVNWAVFIPLYLLTFKIKDGTLKVIHGKYTENIMDYHLAVPHKATVDGEFSTFHLPHFHDPDPAQFKKRQKRELSDPDMVNYGLFVNDELHHIELWPNRDFIHPHILIERRDPTVPLHKRDVRGMDSLKKMCYYTGRVRGVKSSRAAISTCDGLAGTINIGNKMYFIEPVHEHAPNANGHHLHVVYENHPDFHKNFCGVDSSEGSWENSIRDIVRQDYAEHKNLFKKSATAFEVVPQWIQMMVTGDKTFIKKHKGKRDLLQWILAIMNMVRSFYADETMTGYITPVVVRIILLEKEEEEIDLDVTWNIDKTLKSFCNWSLALQQPSGSVHHFDTSILLSDWDFCHTKEDCAVQGIATVGNACGKMPCQVNEVRGFLTGLSITHEQGHLLGMQHDAKPPLCPPNDTTDGMWYVMAPTSEALTVKWSPCSTAAMREMARNHFLDCLNDEPPAADYVIPDGMPGVLSTIAEQCDFYLPYLNFTDTCKEESCRPLYCLRDGKPKCMAYDADVVDGTPCGPNKWCFKTKCVDKGYRPNVVDGGWGEWTDWTKCSRTCGKGIQRRERFCDNPKPANKGKYCLGERSNFKICINEDCPDDQPSFRDQQCRTKFNPKKFKTNMTVNDFQYSDIDPEMRCEILCKFKMPDGELISVDVGRADDGTICTPGVPNTICVDGLCKDVGCDGKFDTSSVEDRCGVCNGDGTMCKLIEGTWTLPNTDEDYTKIVDIPAGARKIEIEEPQSSPNLIALGTTDKSKMFINGDNTRSSPGTRLVGTKLATWAYYTGDKGVPIERITIERAKEDFGVYLLIAADDKTNYTWKWIEASDEPAYEPKYTWDTDEYGECSVQCGGGTQMPKLHCSEEKAGKVSTKFCEKVDKPSLEPKKCNEKPCPTQWKVGIWGRCRACKKKGGVRVRAVECIKKNPKIGADDIIQEDSECAAPKPGTVELCETLKKCGSRRKRAYHIPGKYQEIVWTQMKKLHLVKREAHTRTIATATATFPKRSSTPRTSSSTRYTQALFTGTVELHREEIVVDRGPDVKMVEVEWKVKQVGNLSEQDEKMGAKPGTQMVIGTTKAIPEFMNKIKCQFIKLNQEKKMNRSKMLNSSSNTIKQSLLTEMPLP